MEIKLDEQMTTKEAIKILEDANKWRRCAALLGVEFAPPMPDPKLFGEAIDFVIKELKQSKKDISVLQIQNHNLRVQLSDIKDNSCKF